MSEKQRSIDMIHGPIWHKMLVLAIPIILSSVFQQLFNTADVAVAGRYISNQAMAAVGSNAPVISLFINLFVGLSIGVNVMVAAAIARKRFVIVRKAVHTSILLAVIIGIVVAVVGIIFAKPLLVIIAAPPDVIDIAAAYLRVVVLGMPFFMVYNFGSAILRADGDAARPFYCLIVSSLLNFALDMLFVIVFGWDIEGLALATVIANVLNAVLVIYFMCMEHGYLRLEWSMLGLDRPCVARIVSIGGPAGLQGTVFSLSNVVIQAAINSFGSAAMAGVSAALNFEFFAYFIVNGFAQAAVTFTSQNYATGHLARCRIIFRQSLIGATVFTAVVAAIFLIFRYPLLHIFSTDPEVMEYALIRLCVVTGLEMMTAWYEIPGACLRGMGVSMLPAIETLIGSCVLRIVYIATLFRAMPDYLMMTCIYPVSWAVTGIMVIGTYFYVRAKVFRTRVRLV